jgi:cysteine desulfurase
MRIYLDHAATTPVRPEVLEAMRPYFSTLGYNPSSIHAEGRRARLAVDGARERIAAILRCKPKEIVFCASGTEADNLAVFGIARARREHGKHVVASAIEHHAVLRALDALAAEGFKISLVPVDEHGVVDVQAFTAALRDDTILAAIMYANNEIGTIQPIAQLATIARARGITFMTDAVQAAGSLSLAVDDLGVDALSLSAHKFYGPKGIGALYVRDGTPLEPLVYGGGQESGRRSGTENVAAAVGFGCALSLAETERDASAARVAVLRDRLESAVLAAVPGTIVNGRGTERLPSIASLSFAGLDVEPLLIALDLEGVAASAGSACATGSLEPSHVIAALGVPADAAPATIRFSLGRSTTASEIEHVATLLPRIALEQRKAGPADLATLSV